LRCIPASVRGANVESQVPAIYCGESIGKLFSLNLYHTILMLFQRGEDTAPDFSKPLTRKHIFDTMVKIQAAATKAFETGLLQSNNKH